MRKAFATASSPWNRPPTGCLIEWVDRLKLAISHWSALEKWDGKAQTLPAKQPPCLRKFLLFCEAGLKICWQLPVAVAAAAS
jgi:hypothetical protein